MLVGESGARPLHWKRGPRLNSGGIFAWGPKESHSVERLGAPRRSRDAARKTVPGM